MIDGSKMVIHGILVSARNFIAKHVVLFIILSLIFNVIASLDLPFVAPTFSHGYSEHTYYEEAYLNRFHTDILENIGNDNAFNKEANKSYRNFLFAISNTWRDSCAYVEMVVNGPGQMVAPYKYRLLTPILARGIYIALDVIRPDAYDSTKAIYSILAINVLFFIATGLLFNKYLRDVLDFGEITSVIGVALFISGTSITKILLFPLIDMSSLFFSLLIFYAVKKKYYTLFLFASLFGIFAKEVLVFAAIALFIDRFDIRNMRTNFKYIPLALFPAIIYVVQHLLLGGAAVEVNYSYDLLKLELPKYAFDRLSSLQLMFIFAFNVFITFNIMWLGILNIKKNDFLTKQLLSVGPFVIVSIFFFSTRIERPLFIIFPLVIPLFLRFYDEYLSVKITANPRWLTDTRDSSKS